MNNWCQNCCHWSFAYEDGFQKFGKCNNPSAVDSIRVVQEEEVEDMFTDSFFGCVWFQKTNNVVTKIPNPLKPDNQ